MRKKDLPQQKTEIDYFSLKKEIFKSEDDKKQLVKQFIDKRTELANLLKSDIIDDLQKDLLINDMNTLMTQMNPLALIEFITKYKD